jgi:hypothetical protein
MTNEEMNAKAEQIAVRVRDAVAASQNAQDIYGLVFVNVKALIAELVSGEQPADPCSHWRRRAETAEAEVARLNMEMEAYRQKLTPKDVEAMTAVIKALNAEKAAGTAAQPDTTAEPKRG